MSVRFDSHSSARSFLPSDGRREGERDDGTDRHQHSGQQRIHPARQGHGDGGHIVDDRDRQDGRGDPTAAGGEGEQAADGADPLAEEIEVALSLEDSAADRGSAPTGRGIEGEAVVGAVAEVKGVAGIVRGDPGGFFGGRRAGHDIGGIDPESGGKFPDSLDGIAAENGQLVSEAAKAADFGDGIVAERLLQNEGGEAVRIPGKNEAGAGLGLG